MPDGPAGLKPQVYKDQRPEEFFDKFHERARNKEPRFSYWLVWLLMAPFSWVIFGASSQGRKNVPRRGGAILAPNHFSNMDHFFLAMFLVLRRVRFMAKSQLFVRPVMWIISPGGTFPVRRGWNDVKAFITAKLLLEMGKLVAMYLAGGRSRSGVITDEAKPGVGKLALESGKPVAPVAIHGSEGARNWKRLRFPLVTVKYGELMYFGQIDDPTLEQQQAVANEILVEQKRLYAEVSEYLAKHRIRVVLRRLRPVFTAVAIAIVTYLL